ncbi:MAG: M14 family zinc carboxypeptidase [Gemmatimonadota bacterium]
MTTCTPASGSAHSRPLIRLATLALAIPLALATAPAAPATAQKDAGDNGDVDSPPVPQTFDWWTERGVPETTPWGQPVDTAATRQILSWTTMPEYTTELVDHIPADPTVVSPSDHFGHPVGRPGVLHKVDELYGYYEALAASSPRVDFELLGETEEGNRLAVVQVGGEANIDRLDEIRAGLNALADPRTTSEAEAERLIRELPAVYTFYAGLHSPETGPPEMVMELAYRLAVSDDPVIQRIRDEAVVFIVPVAEPDGRNRVVDWHRRFNADVYDGEDRVPGPPYWGKYIFHDNNRDGLQQSARLTQILTEHFLEWRYPVGHDLHESVPYLYVSTGTGPYNATVDPITISEWQWMSNYEVTRLTSEGMPGVWTHGFYSGWYPGYLLWVTNTRNAVGRFYETFGNSVPNTMVRELGGRSTSTEWYRPNPPRDSTIWSLRNNTNFMQSGAITSLQLVAENRERVLRQYWTKANNSLNKGRTEAPYAYVVPADQKRSEDAEYMLNLLRRQGIEVHRATDDAAYGDVEVGEGDFVVRMDQPFRNFVLTLMERQDFPADAPRPYDDVAWTYPLMFNVETHAVDDDAVFGLAMEPLTGSAAIAGSVEDDDDWWAVRPVASAHQIEAWLALGDVDVFAAEDPIGSGDDALPPGTWLIDADALSESRVESLAEEFGLDVVGVDDDDVEDVARHALDAPRIAMLHTWTRTQPGGWVRYALDQAGVDYDYIAETEIGGMDLGARYDVILMPHQGGDARDIFEGVDPELSPLPYTRTSEYPTHGFPDATDDATGGMGYEGLAALRDFIRGGGTFVALGSAGTLPVEFGMLRDISTTGSGGLFVPGSIVLGEVEQSRHPLAYGYDATVPLYHQFGPYYDVDDDLEPSVIVRYAGADDVFLSGLVNDPGQLAGEPAVISVPSGDGHVVLFGFDPMHRYQSHGNFAFVWNAIMNWNDLDVGLDAEDADEPTVATDGR